MKMKKGQNLSLQTIVVAVLVLMVMIVLIIIFSSKTQPVADMYSKCEDVGGQMKPVADGESCDKLTNGDLPYTHPMYKKEEKGKTIEKCCVEKFI